MATAQPSVQRGGIEEAFPNQGDFIIPHSFTPPVLLVPKASHIRDFVYRYSS